ncbi:MAG: hypothetical protein LBI14_03585 [Treponema sp.]|jgi:hypothetical protein|nr:hypothetical protein [Treponema sp.]
MEKTEHSEIDKLKREIRNYKSLFHCALDIFNRTTVSGVLEAAAWKLSDHFLPSFIVFIRKPLAGKEGIVINGYKNYRHIAPKLNLESIARFEPFFQKNPNPISYDLLAIELKSSAVFDSLSPEVIVPIQDSAGLYGLALVGRKVFEEQYDDADLEYLQHLMFFVSQAIQNHLLDGRVIKKEKEIEKTGLMAKIERMGLMQK